MGNINISKETGSCLTAKLREEIETVPGRKVLEYGSGRCSFAADLRSMLDYLACADSPSEFTGSFREEAEKHDIFLIPDDELGEDCYFGRFHLVYTPFGLRGKPGLVDEIMKLRRLILKGGKIVIIDSAAGDFEAECLKQLKRCGFSDPDMITFDIGNGESAVFMITAQK